MQLEVKAILNRIQHFVGFVYQEVRLGRHRGNLQIEIMLQPHRSIPGKCSQCRQAAPGYDRLPQRWWLFVPWWGIKTYFVYAANANSRCANPLALIGRPRNPFLRIPIRASVCARRRCRRANF